MEERWPGVEFLGGTARQLPLLEALGALGRAKAAVQIVPDEYARVGYYTNRIAEAAAVGVPLFIDAEILERRRKMWVPDAGMDWWWVKDRKDVKDRMGRLNEEVARHHVVAMRAWLKERMGRNVVAGRLVEEAGCG